MASLAHHSAYRQMTVEEFLELEIKGRAELEDGVLYMMAGGSLSHAAVSGNILVGLRTKLRGSGCRPFGPDFAVRTGPSTVRLPDASVYCGLTGSAEEGRAKLAGDPQLVVEVFSLSTRRLDERIKLAEYQQLPGLQIILLVDPEAERVRVVERMGEDAWSDRLLPKGADVPLPALKIELPAAEIFARD
ncbi:MAG TPA: Uma2 family endonuclease [Allosphingosinicella sp.]|jgi:Uma2 family endonuclease